MSVAPSDFPLKHKYLKPTINGFSSLLHACTYEFEKLGSNISFSARQVFVLFWAKYVWAKKYAKQVFVFGQSIFTGSINKLHCLILCIMSALKVCVNLYVLAFKRKKK